MSNNPLYDKKKNIYIEYIMTKAQSGGRRTRRVNAWAKAAGEYYRSHKNDPNIQEFSDVLKSPDFKEYYQAKYGKKSSRASTRKASFKKFEEKEEDDSVWGPDKKTFKEEENQEEKQLFQKNELFNGGKNEEEQEQQEQSELINGGKKGGKNQEEEQQQEEKRELKNGGKKGAKKE